LLTPATAERMSRSERCDAEVGELAKE
jgi:hypothetical protein